MQFSKIASFATLSLAAFASAVPFEARQVPACYTDAATAQATCIDSVPADANGRKDRTAVTACLTTASTAFKACSDTAAATKRQTEPAKSEMETCISKVNDVNVACIEAIPSDENGLKDFAAVEVCSSAAATSFRACVD